MSGYLPILFYSFLKTTLTNFFLLLVILFILFPLLISLFKKSRIPKYKILVFVFLVIQLIPLPLGYILDLYTYPSEVVGEALGVGWPAVFFKYYFARGTTRIIPFNIIIDLIAIVILTSIYFTLTKANREIKGFTKNN